MSGCSYFLPLILAVTVALLVAVNDVACTKLEHSREQLLQLTPLDIEVVETPYAVPRYTRAELVTLSDQEILERENTYARQLVNQILTFSRQTEQVGQVIRVIPIAKEVLRLLPASLPQGIEIKRSIAAAHGIVTSLKGTITVDSELGKGATFHVILPTVEKTAESTPDVETPLPAGSECVMLVDDETEIVKMGAHMLASLGFRSVVANDGEEALRLFELNPDQFDIVITDQVMPGMTGEELTRKLKEARPELPIILCTGFSEVLTPEQARESGVSEFMMKPIGMRQLAEAIKRALGDREPAEDVD